MKKNLITGLVFAAAVLATGAAQASIVYATYTGSQQGVTVRDTNLNQTSYFGTGVNADGIAAGTNNDVYLASGSHLLNYSANGTLLNDMNFGDNSGIVYSDIAVGNNQVFATYTGSQHGITVRDLALNQTSYINTGFDSHGISAGNNNDFYLASFSHIYHYSANGTQIADMNFGDNSGIIYSDVAFAGNQIYAAYTGSQQGVTIRDLNLNQTFYFATNFAADGIAAGNNNDLYLTSGSHLYHYTNTGTLLTDMNFGNNSGIIYTDIAVAAAPVPEPETYAMLMMGLGLVGLFARRKAK